MSDRTLEVAGLQLPLVGTADGPRVAPDGELEGLAVAVNAYFNGVIPDLRDRVRAGEGAGRGGVYVRSLPPEMFERESEPWRRLTRSALGDDPVLAGSSETRAFALPRAALLEILDRMLDLRATELERAEPLPAPEGGTPAVAQQPRRAPEDEAQRALALAVSQRRGAPGRAEELARVEQRARELDAMDDPAQAAARRRAVLLEMDVLRVLSAAGDVGSELRELGLPTLHAYHEAAARLLAYLMSDDRRAALDEDEPHPVVLEARVSIDWFRRNPEETFARTAIGEAMLAAVDVDDAFEGRFYTRWDGRWYEVHWRRDVGETAALLALVTP